MPAWKRQPCQFPACLIPKRKVRGSRYCEFHAPSSDHSTRMKDAYQRNKDLWKRRVRNNELKKKYGLSREEYEQLIGQGCRICGSTERMHVDHDHSTGTVRGALCGNCNAALGLFKDSPALLVRAAEYLKGGDAL